MVDKPSDDVPTIEPLKDGPLKISGLTTFLNSRGENIATKKVIVLCRCGGSKNKPFCDGTHVKIGFVDAKSDDRVSDQLDTYQLYLANFSQIRIRDILERVEGVGHIEVYGARDYSMRVWLDPDRISSLGLTAGDVIDALKEKNVQVAGGTLGQPPLNSPNAFQVNLQFQGRLSAVEEFENIVVKSASEGRFIRLKDLARVELGSSEYGTNAYVNGATAIGLALTQRPDSNALTTAQAVQETMESLSQEFPDDITYNIIYNPTEFIDKSLQQLSNTIL